MRAIAAFALLTFMSATVRADTFTDAIAFAVSGSDATKVVAVNKQNCIFKVGNDTFYFNNIYLDRATTRPMRNNLGREWVEVDLHGKDKIVEIYVEPAKNDGSEIARNMAARYPDMFKPKWQSHTDYVLTVQTKEHDRLVRAWRFIYANGCKAKESPF
jgi:hypothetical protein